MRKVFEERIIDGVLKYRNGPEDEFRPYSPHQITTKLLELLNNHSINSDVNRIIESLATDYQHFSLGDKISFIKEIPSHNGSRFEIYNKSNELDYVVFNNNFIIRYIKLN